MNVPQKKSRTRFWGCESHWIFSVFSPGPSLLARAFARPDAFLLVLGLAELEPFIPLQGKGPSHWWVVLKNHEPKNELQITKRNDEKDATFLGLTKMTMFGGRLCANWICSFSATQWSFGSVASGRRSCAPWPEKNGDMLFLNKRNFDM